MLRLEAIAVLVFCFFAYGCGRGAYDGKSADDADQHSIVVLDSIQAEHDISEDALIWADSIMAEMTLEEMAGQLVMPAVYADANPLALRLVKQYASDCHVGGVVLLQGTIEAARVIADTLRSLSAAPPFIAIDAEWGLAMRLADAHGFPRNGRISDRADEDLMFDYGYEVASECRNIGINMVLGPVLDVLPEGRRSAGIGSRSFGRDAERVAQLGVAYSKGVESGGVISVAKHFPGHGSANGDSHKKLPEVSKSLPQLEATDLMPFRSYVANGLSGIMTGHLNVPALDSVGIPVTVSQKILKDFLRKDIGFGGLVITDAMNMAGAEGAYGADALIAGADIVLAPANTNEEVSRVVEYVRNGDFPIAELHDRVKRVLFYKYMMARDGRSGDEVDCKEAERIRKELEGM